MDKWYGDGSRGLGIYDVDGDIYIWTQRIKCDFLVIYTINRAQFVDVFNVVRISILTNIIITDKRKCNVM